MCIVSEWFVYIIQTESNKFYTGISTDPLRRFLQHLSGIGGAKFFRSTSPLDIVFIQECKNRSEASSLESRIKSLSKIQKKSLIAGLEDYGIFKS